MIYPFFIEKLKAYAFSEGLVLAMCECCKTGGTGARGGIIFLNSSYTLYNIMKNDSGCDDTEG